MDEHLWHLCKNTDLLQVPDLQKTIYTDILKSYWPPNI